MNCLGDSIASVDNVEVSSYTIPTDLPESDGTLEWDKTTIVVVHVHAGGQVGLGYTYADDGVARLIHRKLAPKLRGRDALEIPGCWQAMARSMRNLGHPGIVATAISAVDCALWDLKARLLGVSLVRLLGRAREAVPVYGSGGFTSYTNAQLESQFEAWVASGISRVKMKVGRDPSADLERVQAARAVIGPRTELFVDANGAYSRKQALAQAEAFSRFRVSWFEEPVSSDDLEGLRLIRDRAPAGMDVAAGEYGYTLWYFRRMLDAGAVDVLQADVTRCGGITSFLQVDALCQARCLQLSAHTAPAISMHPGCAAPSVRHVEYFHDHVRIESLLFDGNLTPVNGKLQPDLSQPGMGIVFKRADAERLAA